MRKEPAELHGPGNGENRYRKPKADTTGHDDLDEYDFGEDEDADEEPAEIEIHSEDGQEDET